jgi:hypothetical protein
MSSKIVHSPQPLTDFKRTNEETNHFCHTGALQPHHKERLKCTPRKVLAVLHHNGNTNREATDANLHLWKSWNSVTHWSVKPVKKTGRGTSWSCWRSPFATFWGLLFGRSSSKYCFKYDLPRGYGRGLFQAPFMKIQRLNCTGSLLQTHG